MTITETVLEMHFHRPLMDTMRDTFGLGTQGKVSFYKYSLQKECFVGIDQAYGVSTLNEAEFFDLLKTAANSPHSTLGDQFFGYFLQFKIVKEMNNVNRYTPKQIMKKPHYRVSLDTTKNANTGLSQHELLHNLSKNSGAFVYYACPMIFDKSTLYEVDVDLDALRLADFDDCPSAYQDNDNHFIYFNDSSANPIWCSDPVEGRAVSARDFVSTLIEGEISPDRQTRSSRALLNTLTNFESAGLDREAKVYKGVAEPTLLPMVSDTLTVVRIARGKSGS